ncbi:ABC transporter ATP-binding protein [Halalkalibacillus halophilus]|uniref:ABC transporter ATP-binding protein n=1 Tax=Halalkalibacillus halophilus TaxID=392827 RepID=UPI00041FE8AF|nr:ABC transporter ATP-binding protein [Halalkalibacillus halophilus]
MQHKVKTGSPLLEVKGLSFSYEKKEAPVLNQLNFQINQDEFVLLMGASGSGKSTVSLCLNGLYPEAVEGFQSGDIYFEGKHIESLPKGEINKQIGIVFQDPESQFCMIKVEDELAFTLENRNVPTEEMAEKIDHVLNLVNMKAYKHVAIHELSGGQKQKIALASVLLLEPTLLILDEPTANLDPVSSLEFVKLIRNIREEHQLSVLLIEHQVDDWLEDISRVLLLDQRGSIILADTPNSVFQSNKSLIEELGLFIPRVYQKKKESLPIAVAQTSKENCLRLNQVAFKRWKKEIFKEVNLTLQKDEFVAIVGENGAGKSTLLQLMAGLLKPAAGEVSFLNTPLSKWKEQQLRKHLGFVFQNPEHQFITDTVYDEISFGMTLNEIDPQTMKKRTEDLMEHFHLTAHKWKNPFSLSGGQKRRLSVATMLDETPDLLLFDEPTFGQDAKTSEELMRIIQQIQANGTTIVFVTHDMELVDQYCKRVIVLNDFSIALDGRPEELWEQTELLKQARLRPPARLEATEKVGATP